MSRMQIFGMGYCKFFCHVRHFFVWFRSLENQSINTCLARDAKHFSGERGAMNCEGDSYRPVDKPCSRGGTECTAIPPLTIELTVDSLARQRGYSAVPPKYHRSSNRQARYEREQMYSFTSARNVVEVEGCGACFSERVMLFVNGVNNSIVSSTCVCSNGIKPKLVMGSSLERCLFLSVTVEHPSALCFQLHLDQG